MRRFLLLPILFACFLHPALAQNANDAKMSVMIRAEIQETPPRITLHWVKDTQNSGYSVYRKSKGGSNWGTVLGTTLATDSSWTDTAVNIGQAYEYRVVKNLAGYGGGTSAGYCYAGIDVHPVHTRGTCLVVVDSTFKTSLAPEIARLHRDLEEDGWKVKMLYVDRNDPVPTVRQLIKQALTGDNSFFQTLFLLGRVPVPYSGNIAPDGHVPDHQGAWPCDGYYGDLDGTWTDNTVNVVDASQMRNRNIPGDGKFDQSSFPSTLELGVGRVDFFNLNAFPQSETELLRNYLDKNHAWRKGMLPAVERGLIQNNFAGFAEGFGQNGWKNFVPMFGYPEVKELPYRETLQSQSYLWSYGCGPGSYNSAGGITNTTNFTTDSLQTVFTMLFGSYFGDWDSGNNLLRAALATGTTLTNAWAARPNWMFHHMALGEPIGYCARLSMNNNGALYQSGFGAAGVHTALMGDPTLVMHVLRPPTALMVQQEGFHVHLSWEEVPGALGYHVYKKKEGESEFTVLTGTPLTSNSYTDSCSGDGYTVYQVRAVELRESSSGRYFNLGAGVSDSLTIDYSAIEAQSQFDASVYYDQVTLTNLSQNADYTYWFFSNGFQSEDPNVQVIVPDTGLLNICLAAADACHEDLHCEDVHIQSSLPHITAEILHVTCHGESNGSIGLTLTGGTPQQDIQWSNGQSGPFIDMLDAGTYHCTVTSETGRTGNYGPYDVLQPDSLELIAQIQPSGSGQNNGSVIAFVSGGCNPYSYLWSNGATVAENSGLAPGEYCLTVTDCEGCTRTGCFLVENASSVNGPDAQRDIFLTPNPASGSFRIRVTESAPGLMSAVLHDLNGHAVERRTGPRIMDEWDLTGRPAGTYWMILTTETGVVVIPVVLTGRP